MTRKTRIVLFLSLLVLFFLVVPLIVFYSQGYRYDFENKKITQTGGLFVKVEPKQVEIYINNELTKKTDFFFGSALVENLLPKKYKIEVQKEGYLSWGKNLEIKEKEVIEAKNIVLFPENPNFTILAKEVKNLWFSPDEKKIILVEKEETGWALKLYDLDKNVKSHLINEKDIYAKGAELINLEFSSDSKEIYLDIAMKEQEKHFALSLDKSPPQLMERKVTPIPDYNPTTLPPSAGPYIIASQKINNDFYYLDNFGYVFKNEMKLNEEPFPVQSETEYSLEIFQNVVFLSEGKTLYLFSPDSKSFEKFFEGINDLKISPDNKKIVFFSNSEIWILFLKDADIKKAGEKLFINRLSEKIDAVFWLNPDYLIFNSGDNLKIVEIDDRDRIQTWDIASFPNPEIYFNGSDRKLYILSEGNLYSSGELVR